MTKALTVGIDIGGTNTKFGIVDREGKLYFQGNIQTAAYKEFKDYFKALADGVRDSFQRIPKDSKVVGIGIGAASGNIYTGSIESATNLNWKEDLPLVKLFTEEFNLPCFLTNDANASALGEMTYGHAKGMKDFVVVTLGTGLGSGFVCGGKLVNGHNGIAGELGHVSVNPSGRYCNCGKRGCLETYVSATGLKRTVSKLLADYLEYSELREISESELDTKMISEIALHGDIIANQAFEYTGRILGMKLADAVVYTNPEAIILVGGLTAAGDLLYKPTLFHLEANLMPLFKNKVKLVISSLTDQVSPILGASSLAWSNLENKN